VPRLAVLFALTLVIACGEELVRVTPDGVPTAGTTTALSDPTFEVVAEIAGARDPLPVSGAHVAFADLETALGQAVLRAVKPRHDSVLTVELIAADATYKDSRLAVSMVVRATLRTRLGTTFVAQTQVVCRDGAIIAAESGAKVIWSCMTHLGQDLGGWLAGLPP
jgi:hypothetical protein